MYTPFLDEIRDSSRASLYEFSEVVGREDSFGDILSRKREKMCVSVRVFLFAH